MPISPEEQRDLDEMKSRVTAIKESCFDALSDVIRYTETDLIHSGYRNKTVADAMKGTFEFYQKKVKKEHADHIRKYPD